jgi:hypothetical protein
MAAPKLGLYPDHCLATKNDAVVVDTLFTERCYPIDIGPVLYAVSDDSRPIGGDGERSESTNGTREIST